MINWYALMKFILDEIIYYDEKDPKIEISWSTIHADGTKKPFITEVFKWQNYPEILAPTMLLKMKPLRDEEEPGDEDNLFLGHHTQATRLQRLSKAQLNTTMVLTLNHLNFFNNTKTVTWKKPPKPEQMTSDDLRILYPLSYVIYSEYLLSNGQPCRVPLYMVCHDGVVDEKPEPSMLKEFKPPRSLRHILFPSANQTKSSELAAQNSNSEKTDSHKPDEASIYYPQ